MPDQFVPKYNVTGPMAGSAFVDNVNADKNPASMSFESSRQEAKAKSIEESEG